MDKRLFLAVALSVAVVIAYQQYIQIYYPEQYSRPAPEEQASSPEPEAPARPSGPPASPPAMPAPEKASPETASLAAPEGDIRIENDRFLAELSSRGGRLVSFRLKDYRTAIDPDSLPLELVTSTDSGDPPLGVWIRGDDVWSDRDVLYAPSTRNLRVSGDTDATLALVGQGPGGQPLRKEIVVGGDRYRLDIRVVATALPKTAREVSLAWTHDVTELQGQRGRWSSAQALVGRKLLSFDDEELVRGVVIPDPREGVGVEGPVHWAGYADTYFIDAIMGEGGRLWMKLDGAHLTTEFLQPAGRGTFAFSTFAGPKDLDILQEAGHKLHRGLDLGFFGIVAEPMLRVLKFFHDYTGNYGVDIILLTLIIKVLFIPLTQKSYQSMHDLQKLQPQLKRLQEQYKDDRQELNKQVMELYRRHKVNPLGGCLPMLVQLPVFIGLYNALFYAVELRHAPFMLWINDLSAPDRLPSIPHDPLGVIAGFEIRIPVLTLLMGASMLLQQKMTPTAGDPMQQRMMMLMPVVFTIMFVSFPSGLVLYWFVNNVLTIAQQAYMMRNKAR